MVIESLEWNNPSVSLDTILSKSSRSSNENVRLAIMGGGSWATALAKMALTNLKSINWYMRRQEQIDELLRHPLHRLGRSPSVQYTKASCLPPTIPW